jgi:phosphatidylethanolamine-binding protein (PEBP) family uncharacterized protein
VVRWILAIALAMLPLQPANAVTPTDFKIDFWADNWAAVYVNGVKVAQDPVPITTVKSFNKVSATFKATYPLTIAVIAKDYVENNSGLEYIGAANQQIGDAGLIVQIHETKSGKFVAGTNQFWKSLVLFKAPLNPECVTSNTPIQTCKYSLVSAPSGWYGTKYSDVKWLSSTVYTEGQVGVKEGYNEVTWDSKAKLIWSKSLTQDNTVLFRTTVKAATSAQSLSIAAPQLSGNQMVKANTCDGDGIVPSLTWANPPSGTKSFLLTMDTAPGPARPGEAVQTDFNHLVVYNIPVSSLSFGPQSSVGQLGKNFKGTLGYTPPCSQGPGLKTYTFHLYALSDNLTGAALTGSQALALASGKLLAEAKLDLTYSRG